MFEYAKTSRKYAIKIVISSGFRHSESVATLLYFYFFYVIISDVTEALCQSVFKKQTINACVQFIGQAFEYFSFSYRETSTRSNKTPEEKSISTDRMASNESYHLYESFRVSEFE